MGTVMGLPERKAKNPSSHRLKEKSGAEEIRTGDNAKRIWLIFQSDGFSSLIRGGTAFLSTPL